MEHRDATSVTRLMAIRMRSWGIWRHSGRGLIFALILSASCLQTLDERHRTETTRDLRLITAKLSRYYALRHEYPKTIEDRDFLHVAGVKVLPRDSWGMPLYYQCSNDRQHYRLASAGRDRVISVKSTDDPDDIVVADGHFVTK